MHRFLVVLPALAALGGCAIAETPHAVGAVSDGSCNECHREGAYGAKAIDHPERRHCVSCHEVSDYRPVPHSLEMSNCVACHTTSAGAGPATSHPDRPHCARCHASSK